MRLIIICASVQQWKVFCIWVQRLLLHQQLFIPEQKALPKTSGSYRGSACFCRSNHFSALHLPNLLPSIKAPCTEQVPRAEREKLGGFFILFNPHYSQPMGNPVKRSVRIFSVEGNVTSQLEGSLGRLGVERTDLLQKIPERKVGAPHTAQFTDPVHPFLSTFQRRKGEKITTLKRLCPNIQP